MEWMCHVLPSWAPGNQLVCTPGEACKHAGQSLYIARVDCSLDCHATRHPFANAHFPTSPRAVSKTLRQSRVAPTIKPHLPERFRYSPSRLLKNTVGRHSPSFPMFLSEAVQCVLGDPA